MILRNKARTDPQIVICNRFVQMASCERSDGRSLCRGRKNHDSHRRDRIWRDFLHWIFRYFLQILGGSVLLNYTENLEKKQKIQWRASSGDGAPKLQISVPCRGRTCPDYGIEIWPRAENITSVTLMNTGRKDDFGNHLLITVTDSKFAGIYIFYRYSFPGIRTDEITVSKCYSAECRVFFCIPLRNALHFSLQSLIWRHNCGLYL